MTLVLTLRSTLARIKQLSTCRFIEKGENVFFIGPTGTGKSHLAKAMGQAVCRQYLSVGFYNFHELFTVLSQADLVGKLSKQLNAIIKYDLIIIDDFAYENPVKEPQNIFMPLLMQDIQRNLLF